jgi:hypothetical protein
VVFIYACKDFPAGTRYAAKTTLEAQVKKVNLVIDNSGTKKVQDDKKLNAGL